MKKHAKELIALIILVLLIGAAAVFMPKSIETFAGIDSNLTPLPTGNSQSVKQPGADVTRTPQQTAISNGDTEQPPTPVPSVQTKQNESVTLLFAGDVMTHQKQLDCHKFGSSYDFKDDYKYIKDIVSSADIAVTNLESPMSGEKPYTGAPRFNAPDSVADALIYAGFDVIATANNHIRDQKDDAMKRTVSFLRGKGLGVIGTALGEGDTKYALIKKNGINVGFINFTMSLNSGLAEESEDHVNVLRRDGEYDKGYDMMEEQIRALREQGAEFIVVFMHWGSEYQLEGNETQQEITKRIADLGVDLIIGAHPHVLQNVAEYTSPVTGKNVLIYYSLGNLVSNQPYCYGPGGGECETGALALVKLMRNENGDIVIDSAGYLTTYVLKPNIVKEYTEDGETHRKSTSAYYIVPAETAGNDPSAFEGDEGVFLERIRHGVINGQEIIGESGKGLKMFNFQEYTEWPWKN